jgi:hypothetical protein
MYHKLKLQNSCNTIYLRKVVCLVYITVNTLKKVNNNNNNNNNKRGSWGLDGVGSG